MSEMSTDRVEGEMIDTGVDARQNLHSACSYAAVHFLRSHDKCLRTPELSIRVNQPTNRKGSLDRLCSFTRLPKRTQIRVMSSSSRLKRKRRRTSSRQQADSRFGSPLGKLRTPSAVILAVAFERLTNVIRRYLQPSGPVDSHQLFFKQTGLLQ